MESRLFYQKARREHIETASTLDDYIDGLISEYGDYEDNAYYLPFGRLTLSQKLKLVGLFESDEEHKYGFDVGPLYEDQELINLCLDASTEKRHLFVEKLIANLISSYEDSIQKVIDERSSRLTRFINEDAGLSLYMYPDNGELVWRK